MSELGFPEFKLENKKNIQEKVHLREDITPIGKEIADFAIENEELEDLREQNEGDANNVDFENGDLDALKEKGFKTAGYGSYLISPIDERDWYSDRYLNCTAVVAIGRDKDTNKDISFLSHQNPEYFIDGNSDEVEFFSRELSKSLEELKTCSQGDTVEVLILGGNFNPSAKEKEGDYQHRHYQQSIEKLSKIIQETLGFDPKVLTGPNNNVGSETVILVETQKRKVWVERSKQLPEFNQSYQASKFKEEEARWLTAGK
ncbi:MAG: hypothetical protein A2271_04380 [Candidatus Moranbacteria bacterium RIFOXYA12_FULL_35_19]|nr:MAG: hypothetical protein UR78_C0001G0005 [Candidatus Moranbacteria bacterium GW2011_GWF2_35_39]OGI31738.1 MAG: hypothetical protein A2343_04390 [Candidatus Moranbacteria bacterium RIFOXYB12_FULL_35_8]OGI35678.1 MAG: hypothetical protein A2271_04380 [Candidatus Moranbacteria bacterium RIFOXYA12_FULL_35_19]